MSRLPEPLRDHSAEATLFVRRSIIAAVVVVLLFGVLAFNLYHLQVEEHEQYQTRSNANDIKTLPIAPVRGLIYDRNGIPLVQNQTLYQIELIPGKIADLDATLKALTPIVDLTQDDIDNFHQAMKSSRRFAEVPLKEALTDVEVARFFGQRIRIPRCVYQSLSAALLPLWCRARACGGLRLKD
jgi:penicillin-binding protein 2